MRFGAVGCGVQRDEVGIEDNLDGFESEGGGGEKGGSEDKSAKELHG